MARDFEDIHDLDDLSDGELRALVREHLAAHNALDIDDFTVQVEDGIVVLSGRVGTDGERLIAEHVVTDLVGTQRCRNEVFVDPARRAISPEAESAEENVDAELFGTTDLGQAIQDGTPWIPPESPTQEGFTERNEFGEDH